MPQPHTHKKRGKLRFALYGILTFAGILTLSFLMYTGVIPVMEFLDGFSVTLDDVKNAIIIVLGLFVVALLLMETEGDKDSD